MSNVPESINPGIKQFVTWLNDKGFTTIDSGDGETEDYECDRDTPYVVIEVHARSMITMSNTLLTCIQVELGLEVSPVGEGSISIQASYDPVNEIGVIEVYGVNDAIAFPDEGREDTRA